MRRYDIVPNKGLGQNFLVNEGILEKIASIIDIKCMNVIEVGPGYGALTEKLLEKKPKSLELVELDRKMIDILHDRISNKDLILDDSTSFSINNIDILKYFPKTEDYVVIANIPYYITSPILSHFFFEADFAPKEMIILMQRDVADKICKKKGNKNSVLSLYCELATDEIKEVIKVSAGSFNPPPKVESSVVYFKIKKTFDKNIALGTLNIIKKGFSEKRKKLFSNLVKNGIDKIKLTDYFSKYDINPNIRAEELSIEDWLSLYGEVLI